MSCDKIPTQTMQDDAILEEIASYGGTHGPDVFIERELQECLGFADEVFRTGRMRSKSRHRAIVILERLRRLPPGRPNVPHAPGQE